MMLPLTNGEEAKPAALYEQILLFGDSITEFAERQELGFGFAAQVRGDYIRRLEVVNRGCSGYNTELALRVISHVMPTPAQAKVRLLTLFFGANDSCFPVSEPGQNQCVPIPQFRSNLIDLVRHPSVTAHNAKIVLFTPPPIDERQQGVVDASKGFNAPRRSAENTQKYAQAVLDVAQQELNVPVVDLWTKFMYHCGWRPGQPLLGSADQQPSQQFLELFTDGLHLSPIGYKLMYDEFKAVVSHSWPELEPENLPYVLPIWNLFPDGWAGPPKS